MASNISRKELKEDKFVTDVGQTVDFFAAHRAEMIRYGAIALVLIAIGAGIYYYNNSQRAAREQTLADAIAIANAPIGSPATPGALSFPTGNAKSVAMTKAFNKVISNYGGSQEAYVAKYFLAARAVEAGKPDEARKNYQDVADHADANYSSLAKLALAQLNFSQNRAADSERLFKDLMDHPTDLVSKLQATMVYAKTIAATKPDEARKLLTQIATDKNYSDVSQIASAALSDLPGK